jgi:hypothetical protein
MLLVQEKNWEAQGKNLQGGEEDQTYVVQVKVKVTCRYLH